MKKRMIKKIFSAILAASVALSACDFSGLGGNALTAKAAEVSGIGNANFDFENDLAGWELNGDVQIKSSGAQHGNKYAYLPANASVTMTLTGVSQGSYTLSAWVRGAAGRDAAIRVSETGGPDSLTLLDVWKKDGAWTQTGHRNVLVYNGQMKITISAGSAPLDLDHLELALDAEDAHTITNWDFEDGLASWTKEGTAAEDGDNADTGAKAARLSAGSEISQTVTVKPNTKYALTMRAKVDKQDVFETEKITSGYRKDDAGNPAVMGELQERVSLGDRVNLGVRTADGEVLRQAPSGTEGYSLVSLVFTTGEDDTSVEIYANTKYDDHYKDSVTIYQTEGSRLADAWQGNGSDNAYVDNFDLFQIQDGNYLKGADVSFLPAIEDLGGKYFANGVQQDCLRILANHGVNSITNMLFVKAGEPARYPDSLKTVYIDEYWNDNYWFQEDGSQAELKMIQGGYFDKEHSLELGKRATALGMSYLPSFHYSDTWMSAAKAFCPSEWLDTDYDSETGYKNTDLSHMQAIVYNYVYDFIKALADNQVNVCGVKHGNEQDGGIIRPIGSGVGEGHAKIIAASYQAAEDALPGVSGYAHTNSGYETNKFSNFFQKLINSGAKMDGTAFSLYGGRNSGNIVKIAKFMAEDQNLRYLDYINVETGFTFTRYRPTVDTANSSMYQNKYYYGNPNGQYNWLLDYAQSALDAPNPYGQTRGFYYWETDWIPTPGAGSTDGGSADVSQRIMFNNGDTAIQEMGSTKPGKAGDMMDSMYAYLIRGCSKEKAQSLHTESSGEGEYAVEVAEPEGISLSETSLTLTEGEKQRLKPTITPIDKVLSDSKISYTSADPSIARVTKDGFVCAQKAGNVTITAAVKGGHKASVNVMVTPAAKAGEITLKADQETIADEGAKTAKLFDKIQLTSTLSGASTNQTVVYTSSNPQVASFLGETWQTKKGQMLQETEKTDTLVQLNVMGAGSTVITAASADGAVSTSFTLTASKVDAKKVTVDPAEVSVSYGRSVQLSASVEPENTTRYKVRWESADENIAKVDENGKVTATGVGDVVIKAISDDNDAVFGTCTVHSTEVKAEGVELDRENLVMQVNSTKTLNALVSPADAYNKKVTWTSANEKIAAVNDKGEVTGVAVGGPVAVTATTEDGGFTASCQVTVQKDAVPVTGLTMKESEYYFASDYFSEVHQEEDAPVYRLTAQIEPETATNTEVTWSSDDLQVATVDQFGRVTAVGSGVAVITATAKDGGFTAQTKVYVPSVSESFDHREDGDAWGMTIPGCFSNKAAKLSSSVMAAGEGKILNLSTSKASGGRGLQKALPQAIKNDKIVLDFDWNAGTVSGSKGCYLTITDSGDNSYFSIQTNTKSELVFSVGGKPADGVELSNAVQVGEGFNQNDAWYHLHIILDMKAQKTAFTITSLANPQLTASHEAEFKAGVGDAKDVAAIQFIATRNGSLSWNTALDNLNIYKAALSAKAISADKEKVKLIPVKDTLGAKCKITASVVPAGAHQELQWESSDPSLVTVDETGLVTPKTTYDSLEEIVPGNCTVKVSSVDDPSIFKEIPVEISNTPNASEFFSIYDDAGREVFPSGEGEVIRLETGDRMQFFPRLTGGDGDSDVAGVKWESSNSKVVSVDPESGMVKAVEPGEAKVTLTVTMYAGNPLTGEIGFTVAGESLADTSGLEAAIAAAQAAKTEDDDYYTQDSLANYKQALKKAEEDLAKAVSEKWNEEKQSILDQDAEDLNAAVQGLTKENGIKSISIEGVNGRLWLNKKVQLTAVTVPADAQEEVLWSSSDTSVVVVDKKSGLTVPVGEGTATITAAGANGKVEASQEVTVVDLKDLTSWHNENGVTVTATNTKAGREIDHALNNAQKNDWSGGSKGEEAWSTGSTAVGIITIDLGAKAKIDNVKTCFYSIMKYTLDVSDDGENWTTAVDHSQEAVGALNTSATEPFADAFPENTAARYVRLNILENTGGGWTGVTFLQVNGTFVPEIRIAKSVTCQPVQTPADTELTPEILPETATVTLNTDETIELPVSWKEEDLEEAANAHRAGEFDIAGTVVLDEISYDIICKLTLEAVDISAAQITLSGERFDYTGTAIEPKVTVTMNGKTLAEEDYAVSYDNNIQPGTATVTVEGKNIYTGSAAKNFTIEKKTVVAAKKNLSAAAVTLERDSFVYDKTPKTPAVKVALNGVEVPKEGYDVSYEQNINAGTAKVIVTGKADYEGSVSKTFTIAKADAKVVLKKSSLKKVYGNKNFALGASASSGGKLSYRLNNKSVIKLTGAKAKIIGCGKVTVSIQAAETENYKAANGTLTISVVPKKAALKSVKSKKSKQMTVSWKRDKKASGYTICYATNKKFKKAKKVNVTSNKRTSKVISKLSKGKTYYVKVCAFKTVKGKKLSGSYSAVKKIKIKK